MKIAITADLHLAAKGDYPERYNALDNIMGQLKAENIETLIIAGDLFDKDFQNYSDFEQICRKYPQIQLHIIPGNHDKGISPKNITGQSVHIYTDPTTIDFHSRTFLFIPYEEKAKMSDKIAGMEDTIKGKDWVLIGHGDYYGGVKELNQLEPGTYMPLSKRNVETYRPIAVFLGHIHLSGNQDAVYYAGSPCGLDISETGKRTFLVYDTDVGNIMRRTVETDVIYFMESFVIVPSENEVLNLGQAIFKKIAAWDMDPDDRLKIVVRVQAIGYTTDKSAVLSTLSEGFTGFKYFKNEGPLIDRLSVSEDRQLATVAERTIKLIDGLDWKFGGDEPEREQLKMQALTTIYGT
jgi:exonuclease SbcD